MMGTGGSIGGGIPMATGAAIACPDRKVINLEADGSGMYTVQGLWTQARENLDVVTIVFANRTYAILHGEMRNVGVNAIGENARRMLDLDHPALDWVSLAKGMGVEAARADTCEALRRAAGQRSVAARAVPDRSCDLSAQFRRDRIWPTSGSFHQEPPVRSPARAHRLSIHRQAIR